MSAALAFDNAAFSSGGPPSLTGVTGEVEPGEALALIGPNGAGKTTLLKGIVGSTVLADGTMSIDRRGALGYVPQVADLDPTFPVTVAQVVGMGLYGELGWFQRLSRRHKERIAQALDRVGFADRGDVHFGTLSGGQRQRVLLARAIVADPTIILLDEPFAGVDPIAVGDIRNIITHLTDRGIGVLITDHNVRETLKSCDYAYILSEGSVIAAGSPAEIVANEEARRVYLGEDFELH